MLKYYNLLLVFFIKSLNKVGLKKYKIQNIFKLKYLLNLNYKKNREFNFIQVGANDGRSFDFLYEFVITRISKGIVIEPIEDYYKELVENYKDFSNIIKINKGVHPLKKTESIYKIKKSSMYKYPDWVKGIASFDIKHYKKNLIADEDIEEVTVYTDTLMNIIKKNYKKKKLDYIQIDTEGFDFEVIKMLDFKYLKPTIIKYEIINLNDDDIVASIKKLKKEGYYIFKEGMDMIGVNLNDIKLL